MMTRFLLLSIILLYVTVTSSQIVIKDRIDDKQVRLLLKALENKKDDTIRIAILLKLTEHNLEKEGYETADLDSAATFIKKAKELNAKQNNIKYNGLILIYESDLTRKRGDTILARYLINQAISQLQNSNDELPLTQAYLELAQCYNSKVPEEAAVIKNAFSTLFQRLRKRVNLDQPTESDHLNPFVLELVNFYQLKTRAYTTIARLDFLVHLRDLCNKSDNKLTEFWVRKEIADIHYQQGKLKMAIDELLVIASEQKAGGFPGICFTYDLLSGLYYSNDNYDRALYYALETIKNVRTEMDSFYLPNFYTRVAVNYSVTGSESEALNWNIKRLNFLIAVKKTHTVYASINEVTASMIKLGKPKEALEMVLDKRKSLVPSGNWEKRSMLISLARCYAAVKNNALAEKYCEELIKLTELRVKQKEVLGDLAVDEFLSTFYLAVGQYSKAEKYYKSAIYKRRQTPSDGDAFYEKSFLFKLDSGRGNYLSAIKHLQAYQKAKDSVFTVTKTRQIEELKIAYATEQKDHLINLNEANIKLLNKQDQLQKNRLQQGSLLRNISFAIVILLVIIVALLYNRYRLKQRTNKKLELHQGEIAKQNISLHHLLNEKEWLLKEIHHRVKNNLQIVMSLLNSQSAYIENDAALTAIHDSQHRVHAMSLIHQKLYNSENVSSIDMSFYIRELVSYLTDSFDTGRCIRFDLAIEPLEMDVSQAVPLGLILNEAITNSIKYAFPDNRDGVISISLSNRASNHYLLRVSDNGIGMPTKSDNKKSGSLGMSLMAGLSEDLDGNFSIENKNGTTIEISFVHDPGVKRSDTLEASFVSIN